MCFRQFHSQPAQKIENKLARNLFEDIRNLATFFEKIKMNAVRISSKCSNCFKWWRSTHQARRKKRVCEAYNILIL